MNDFIIGLSIGLFGFMILEPLIINFIYLSNIDLFCDFILFKRNVIRLNKYFLKNNYNGE